MFKKEKNSEIKLNKGKYDSNSKIVGKLETT